MTSTPEELPAGLQPAPAVDPAGQPIANPNGHGPTLTAAQQTAQNTGALAAMLPQLPAAIAAALGPHLPPRPLCAQCLAARMGWQHAHGDELKQAIDAAKHAAGIPDEIPLPPGFDPSPFLPPHLRPGGTQGMPAVQFRDTTVNGTDVCAQHLPGAPTSRQPLLIAHGSLTSSMLGQLGG